MVQNELTHWGIPGMKWGVRRFQNKDGSLTAAGKKRQAEQDDEAKAEALVEEKRARLLKSTDAGELYKNRDMLTTAEINERLNRIDTERRLGQVAEGTKKTGMERVNQLLSYGRKINEVYEFATTSTIGKAVMKALGIKTEDKRLSLKEAYDQRDSLSDKALSDALKRASTEKAIKKILDEAEEAEAKNNSSKNNSQDDELLRGTVEGEGRSKSTSNNKSARSYDDVIDSFFKDDRVSEAAQIGQNYVIGLLEDKLMK